MRSLFILLVLGLSTSSTFARDAKVGQSAVLCRSATSIETGTGQWQLIASVDVLNEVLASNPIEIPMRQEKLVFKAPFTISAPSIGADSTNTFGKTCVTVTKR